VALRETLKELIAAGREREARDLFPHVDEPATGPGHWSAKDNVSHLSAWRLRAAAELDAVRTGSPAPDVLDETDEYNAVIYKETCDLPAGVVLETAESSWESLSRSLEACDEADLRKPRLRRPEQEVWQIVPGNTYFHVAQHIESCHNN
jgi:hypothetical protein